MVNVSKLQKSLTGYISDMKNKSVVAINAITEERKKKMIAISPIDTGDYVSSHKINKAKILSDRVEGGNFNDSDNAFWVEFWFRKDPVNRHQASSSSQPYSQRKVIYNWVGASVYTRVASDTNLTDTILQQKLR